MRTAAVLEGSEISNIIVIADGVDGDNLLSETCVEITELNPQPTLGVGWTYKNGEFVPPPVSSLTEEEIRFARHAAYAAPDGPDSIFMRWQRGDATEQEWLEAVQAVKDEYPYPPQPAA
jgi:hypothetical protein